MDNEDKMTQKTARKTAPTENTLPPLPEGWEWVTLQEVAEQDGIFKDGDWVESKDQDPNGDVRLIQLADIGDGHYRNKSSRFLTYEKAIELRCTFLKPGDVLIARMPDPLGRACIFPGDKKKSVTVVDVCIVRSGILQTNHKWIMYAINAPQFRNNVSKFQSGSTRKRISRKNLAKIRLPLPPRPEQERIVAQIEALFSHLEAAQTTLARTQRNLKRYRASVLKAAVEGRLVSHRRGGFQTRPYPDTPDAQGESGGQLLQRILAERRARWEAQEWDRLVVKAKKKAAQARRKAHGQPARLSDIPEAEWQAIPETEYQRYLPKNDKWKAKYKAPAPPDTANLPDLPDGWVWASAEQILRRITDGEHITPPRTDSGIPLLSARNVLNGSLSLENIDYISQETHEKLSKRLIIEAGDVLMSCSGTVGRSCVAPDLKFSLVRSVAVLKPYFNMGAFISYAIRSPFLQSQIDQKKTQTAQANIFQGKIKTLVFPLPPLAEQERIVAEVERRLAAARRLEETVTANLRRLARLRQAILKAAFAGELVSPHS